MNINELDELTKAATTGPWIGAGPYFGAAMPKLINEVLVDRSRAFCEIKRLHYACEINARFHLENGYFNQRHASQ